MQHLLVLFLIQKCRLIKQNNILYGWVIDTQTDTFNGLKQKVYSIQFTIKYRAFLFDLLFGEVYGLRNRLVNDDLIYSD